MLPNTNEEQEILDVYNKWQHAYLHGDIGTYSFYLDENYHFIGSTSNEEFLTKEETIDFFKATAEQLNGKTDIRNNTKTIERFGELCFITEVLDGYFLSEGNWTYYGRFRFSSVLQKKPEGWRFIYQHFSTPDAKADEGETIGYEKVSKENRILRDAIKRRTIELEHRNRELELVASLEKVRAVATGMQESRQLAEVVSVMYRELDNLKITHVACELILCDKQTDQLQYWSASAKDAYTTRSYQVSRHDHPFFENQWQAWYKGQERFVITLTGTEKQEWEDFILEKTEFRHYPEEVKTQIRRRKTDVFTHARLRYGLLESVGDIALPDEDFNVLRKFADVFEQAYTRFLDLQKAEAQTKESLIEAALERVRSASMAMHRSEELSDVIKVVSQQLQHLGFRFDNASFVLSSATEDYDFWFSIPGQDQPHHIHVPYLDNPINNNAREARSRGLKLYTDIIDPAASRAWHQHMFDNNQMDFLSAESKRIVLKGGFARSVAIMPNIMLVVGNYASKPYSEDENAIIGRFANVFEQSYTRFLDLKKAEAQAREAQIEAALERVRSRTMAMHKSAELNETADLLFDQLRQLGAELQGVAFAICEKESPIVQKWTSIGLFSHPYDIEPGEKRMYEAWKNQEGLYEEIYEGEKQKKYYEAFMEIPAFRQGLQKFIDSGYPIPTWQKNHAVTFKHGYLLFITLKPFNETQIFLRFGRVFEQTYTRFLDLQKAEAQTREAQIEAALEKVRAQAMAMHRSDELLNLCEVMYNEFKGLGFDEIRNAMIHTFNEQNDFFLDYDYSGSAGRKITQLPTKGIPDVELYLSEIKKSKDSFLELVYSGAELESWKNIRTATGQLEDSRIDSADSLYYYFYSIGMGDIGISTFAPVSKEKRQVLERFRNVFHLSYQRYKDIENAEAQAREAQIEAALERVRARTMAMHNSEDVSVATATMFIELEKLGVENFRGGILNIRENKTMDVWSVNKSPDSDPHDPVGRGKTIRAAGEWDMTLHPWWELLYTGWTHKDEFLYYLLTGKEKEEYVKILDARRDYIPGGIKELPDCHIQAYYFGEGAVWTFSLLPHSDENKQVMMRFASVFSLTFRRYQDLKKAEEQAREAKIEAAMEKVRARAMAMQEPNELIEVAELLRKEMGLLGVEELETSSIYIHNEAGGTTECWYAIKDIRDNEKKLLADYMTIDLKDTWVGREMLEFYRSDLQQVSILMRGENRKEWINYCAEHSKLLKGYYGEVIPERTYHLLKFSNGYIGAASPGEISRESWDLLKRATTVFSLAYTRFSDLQIAEASAKEAVKQAALDRIRADIASMRTISDLDRITPLIWNELTILGIPFIRCGVFIMDEKQQLIHTFLSNPEGKAIAAFHLPYDTPGKLSKVLSHWKKHKIYIDHWDQNAFAEIADILVKQRAVSTPGQYLGSIPQGGFYLHFLPFLQGMLYAGNIVQLADDDIKLLQSVAEAFSTAYARYEDFNKLESAKQQVEKTLSDLKQAQAQLVQSEKMASLGELTAGIAHEIQNPLNFVNNFSDVSKELLEEMKDQLATGHIQQAAEIAGDVIGNLEKILHHGKRADGIVKGMLQHSRAGSGQKELTDINALTDEYLRLAYHGLRAKDKSFNATFETHYDDAMDKINIIPQDIGRVILNLINNAFYAVTEKKKWNIEGYKPTVSVSTLRHNYTIVIRVQDNGIGISKKILDKIFQPFFTTKPTGQGTGLGLSLAYDIVRAHGGELKVESLSDDLSAEGALKAEAEVQTGTEGKGLHTGKSGSVFIIQLPIS